MKIASFRKRLAALAYDAIALFGMGFAAGFIALAILGEAFLDTPYFSVYLAVVFFIMYGLSWTKSGQSLGMQTWSLKLVDQHGNKIRWGRATLRYAACYLSWITFGLGFAWALIRKDRRTLHDVIANTFVVDIKQS